MGKPEELAFLIAVTGIAISVLLNYAGSLLIWYRNKNNPTEEDDVIQEQISNLDAISKSLEDLKIIVSDQKKSITESQQLKLQLENENKILEPIVATNRETIEAILEANNKNQNKSKWAERLISFFLGVASSALVTLFFNYHYSNNSQIDGNNLQKDTTGISTTDNSLLRDDNKEVKLLDTVK